MKRTAIIILSIILSLFLSGCQSTESNKTLPQQLSEQKNPVSEQKKSTDSNLKIEGDLAPEFKINTIQKDSNASKTRAIAITSEGFQPSEVTVAVGGKVIFVNTDEKEHWPASDPHPSHSLCPQLDSLAGLKQNEKFEVTLNEIKDCPFHDHLNTNFKGVIKVVQN